MPATDADPEVGDTSVLSVRTVEVFPAPLGPRNPKTSPRLTLKEDVGKCHPIPELFRKVLNDDDRVARRSAGLTLADEASRLGHDRLGNLVRRLIVVRGRRRGRHGGVTQ